MFTGIVENVGKVVAFEERRGRRLQLELPFEDGGGLRLGDSLAVDGCCLTVAEIKENRYRIRPPQRNLAARRFARSNLATPEPGTVSPQTVA